MNKEHIRKIRILPETVSSRIAAGEVVERPAAVVRELIDNSLDADSTVITVDIEDGGRRAIRVADNGEGMTREDAQLACQRFATSKLQTEQDLFSITTMGFRGEALPSIAAVSKFRLLTVFRGEMTGTEILSEGGNSWKVQDHTAAAGTLVDVNDLFFNTPGRQKFLKSATTEFSKICHTVQQSALVRPLVHFRLIHNGHSVFDYPSVSSQEDRMIQIYGDRFMGKFLWVNHERSGLHVEGFTVSPHYTRTSRSPQEIFVNRRSVKNTTIAHAAYEAYESFLPKGRHPIFALFVDLDPTSVDVNVHPAKREIRFSNPEIIHRVIKEAIRLPIHHQTTGDPIQSSISPTPSVSPSAHNVGNSPIPSGQRAFLEQSPKTVPSATWAMHAQENLPIAAADNQAVHESRPSYVTEKELEIVPLGQMNRTYLIAQVNAELQVVDQHTAHERVLFERLLRAWHHETIQTQALLIPEPIDLPPHEGDVLDSYLPELAKLGLEIERFGNQSFIVRSVPLLLGTLSYSSLIQDLLHDLSEWHSSDSLEKKVRSLLASMACQGAVQAGRPMGEPEIKQLLTDWIQEGYPTTCPHGRRIALRLSSDELNRIFGRT